MAGKALLALLCALLFGGTAAAADITARYVLPTIGNAVMTVEADGRGNSRISMDGRQGMVTTGGVSYFIMADDDGLVVVKRDDALAVMTALAREMVGGPDVPEGALPSPSGPAPTEAGNETVAGQPGRRWILVTDARSDKTGADVVLSEEPVLAPIGQALAIQFNIDPLATGFSVGPGGLSIMGSPATIALLRSGTLQRYGEAARLENVSRAPIPPSAFALPAAPMTRAAYARRLREGLLPPP